MTKYRDILRLSSMGLSQRSIASSCQCSQNTVSEVLNRAKENELAWPLPEDVANADLQYLLFPEKAQASSRKVPDCEYIHRELAKSGVTLSLLWNEYCEMCRLSHEIPLKYTQYCNYYRKYAATMKATMHIQRKPGEQMEVDWPVRLRQSWMPKRGNCCPCISSSPRYPAANMLTWRASCPRIKKAGLRPILTRLLISAVSPKS